MDIGSLGVWYWTDGMTWPENVEAARRLEVLGYKTFWIPEAIGREPFATAAGLLLSTETLILATGIANIYARDAVATAQGQKTLAEMSGGRFLLGLGVSHKPMVEKVRKGVQTTPFSDLKRYLEIMPRAPWMSVAPPEDMPVVLGGLFPKTTKLAAEVCDGIHPYLVPPEHTAWAREVVGPDKWVCTEQFVILETDADKARAIGRQALGLYLNLPNYRNNLMRWGMEASDFENGGSDRLVDFTMAWGDEDAIAARIKAHHDAGANHVCIQPLSPEGRQTPDWNALEAFAPAKN